MTVYQAVTEEARRKAAPLFEGWEETMIWSGLQGHMGKVFTDNREQPKSAQIVIADFCFFAGEVKEELVRHQVWDSDFIIMVGQREEWERAIEGVYGEGARKVERYAIKKEGNIFDAAELQRITKSLDTGYEVKLIDEEVYKKAMSEEWSKDLCAQFEDYEDYRKRGVGAAVLKGGKLVSGASSYTVYDGGIEVEIDTRAEYRRQGLAAACGAALILECLKRGWYPGWDAQNPGSVALAQKLGYHFDHTYHAYEVTDKMD